jgi:heptose I phosphotransferase
MMLNTLYIVDELEKQMVDGDKFCIIMSMNGQSFRKVKSRNTIKVELYSQSYFIKQHFGVGWAEIIKNLLSFKKPIISAKTEWQAIQKLDEIGIATTPLVAYGERGLNPAKRQSFVLTKDLGDITSLETLCAQWSEQPPNIDFKRKLILATAQLAKTLHDNGMNHRDFYICHICIDNQKLSKGELFLYLIDLHRVGIRHKILASDQMKDLAGLYFSAMHIGLSQLDFYRFLKAYTGQRLSALSKQDWAFWQQVHKRALRLDAKFKAKIAAGVKL